MTQTLIPNLLSWSNLVLLVVCYLLALFLWFAKKQQLRSKIQYLLYFWLGYQLVYALSLTWSQYRTWQQTAAVLTEITLPVSVKLTGIWQWFDSLHHIKGGYFIFYGFYHFWQSLVIAAILGFLFYVLLRELQKRQDTLFDQGEICLMLFAWFWLGWPRLVFLLSGGLLLAAILAIIKQLSHATEESRRISLGTAFIILAPALMIIGHRLLGLFGLNGLKI